MTRWLLVSGLVVLAGLLVGTPAATEIGVQERATQRALYGVDWRGSLALVRVDRDTLRPLAGPRVPLPPAEPLGWSFAPDRSRMALGSAARGAKLRLVDLHAMRALGDVTVTRRGSLEATAWAGPRRVLAVVVTPGCCGAGDTIVAGVDAGRRRVVWRRTLGGSLQAGERFRRGLLLVLGPRGRTVGPSRLVQLGPRGGIRSAALPEIRSGSAPEGFVTQSWNPGLAIDRAGGRAFVVQAQAPVAEVDLATFQVRSHPLQRGAQAADAVAGPRGGGSPGPPCRWPTPAAGVRARSTLARPTLRSSPAHCSPPPFTSTPAARRHPGADSQATRPPAKTRSSSLAQSRSPAYNRSVGTRWWEDDAGPRSSKPARAVSCATTGASP